MTLGLKARWVAALGLAAWCAGCTGVTTAYEEVVLAAAMEEAPTGGATDTSPGAAPDAGDTAPAAKPQLTAVVVSLRQCLEWALEYNLGLRIQRLTPDIRDAQIVEALASFDATFNGGYNFADTETPATSLLTGTTTDENETHAANLGLMKRLFPGTQVNVGLDWNRLDTNNTFISPDPQHNTTFGVGLTQPLLRDFGVGVNTAAIRIARNTKAGSISTFRSNVEATLQAVEEVYWTLYLTIEELKVRQRQLERAKDLLDRAQKLVAAGRSARVEQVSAEAEVARVQAQIVVAENAIRRAEDVLKRLVNHPTLQLSVRRTRVVLADGPSDAPYQVDPDQAVAEALKKRPDLRNLELAKRNADIRESVAENQLLPRLDLTLRTALHGLDRRFGNSLEEPTQFDYQDWIAGLTAQIPLGNRAARSRLLQARLGRQQAALSVADLRQQIVLEVVRAIDDLRTSREEINAAREATRLARERLKDEEALYRNERSTRTDVLQAQTALAEAELNDIRAIIGFNINKSSLGRLRGTYLEMNRIEVAEPGED